MGKAAVTLERVRKAKKLFLKTHKNDKTVGCGVSRMADCDDYCIKVNLSEPLPEEDCPKVFMGVAVVYEVVGKIHPQK